MNVSGREVPIAERIPPSTFTRKQRLASVLVRDTLYGARLTETDRGSTHRRPEDTDTERYDPQRRYASQDRLCPCAASIVSHR